MNNFWKELPPQSIALAPMEDVTDSAFRRLMLEVMEPNCLHLLFTEFVATDGLCHPIGRERVSHRLFVSPEEKQLLKEKNVKIIAQIWGATPEKFATSIRECIDPEVFDGIDINMGCPVSKIVKQGGCSALIGTPTLAQELILAAKEASPIPVSVKTRTGIKEHTTEAWMEAVIATKPAAITLHGRSQKQMSDGKADWDQIALGAKMAHAEGIPFWGNGDVETLAQAREYCETYGVDGVMIGRGIFKDPWLFAPDHYGENPPDKMTKLRQLWYHTCLFNDLWAGQKNFLILRRFYKIYLQNFHRAPALRGSIMGAGNIEQVAEILRGEGLDI